jgi:outer membrane lipoprotein-sorting protein
MLRKTSLLAFAAVLSVAAAQAQTVDEIIAKNLEARGGKDKIGAVQSARFTGRMTLGEGMEAPIVLVWRRPNLVRMEFTIQGMTAVQAYDGKNGWAVMPFMGKKDPEPMSADELKDVEDMGDLFEGPLYNYAAKGHQVELLGKEDVEGTPAYKLKLTKKNGDVVTMYLDADAYLEIKSEGKSNRRGQEIEFESSEGDYKEVEGILFAHSMEQKPKGAPAGQTITVDKVELNVDLPDSHFAMPAVTVEAPAPAN